MNIRVYKEFSFLNLLIILLIINLILDIFCPIHIGILYFVKIPVSNIYYYSKLLPYLTIFTVPSILSNFLTLYLIPLSAIGLGIEKLLIKYGKILPKEQVEFSKKKKIMFYIILTLAILAYLVSLGGWIHTMIPYSPEELEQLRYD